MKFNTSKYNSHWHDKELSELGSFQRGMTWFNGFDYPR
jgi:hypothetical protein